MIVVSAATGAYGSLVVKHLLNRVPAAQIAVAVRNPDKAADLATRGVQVRFADYDDPDSMRTAFQGADRLLFISSPGSDTGPRTVQHRRVVDAAAHAGVDAVLYTSGVGADVIEEGLLGDHHDTELALRDSGLQHSFLRHPIYTEMFIDADLLRQAVEGGVFTGSTGDNVLNTATRNDLAEAAAIILTSDDQPREAYQFTGPLWTYPQAAAALSEISGKQVRYRDTDEGEGAMAFFGPIVRAGGFQTATRDLEQTLGRPPTDIRAAITAALNTPAGENAHAT